MSQTVDPDPAATVIVLRPAASDFEVLLVHRHPRGFFGSLSVFPGGGVDEVDTGDLAQAVAPGFEEDHDHRVAALRELAEETGLAATPGAMVESPTLRGQALFSELGARGLRLDIGSLILVSRWVTPEGAPRRFDTRFYLLETDETPEVTIDTDELDVAATCAAVDAALATAARGACEGEGR